VNPGAKLTASLPPSPFSMVHQAAPRASPLTSPLQQQLLPHQHHHQQALQAPSLTSPQSDARWTPRYTSVIMAGGDIVQVTYSSFE